MTSPGRVIKLDEESRVGEARREAAAMGQRIGLSVNAISDLSIIVNEAATNVLRHAQRGELVFQALSQGDAVGVQVLALDNGPGMEDVDKCLADGFSTGGTAGKGLGSISRQASVFDIYSAPGRGTAVLAQMWSAPPPRQPLTVGWVCVPIPSEQAVGDGLFIEVGVHSGRLAVVDGLGHGMGASHAAREAEKVLSGAQARTPVEAMENVHHALRPTRGAVMGMCDVDLVAQQIHFCGVGNISAALCNAIESRHMVSVNGTLGHETRTLRPYVYPYPSERGWVLVMHSDGLDARWKVRTYPGLNLRHPAVIAGVLYRDHSRGRDDVTVLCAVRTREAA